MSEFLAVLAHTFKENARKKSFIISNVIMILLVVLLLSLPAIINLFKNDDSGSQNVNPTGGSDKKSAIWVIDAQGVYTQDVENLSKLYPDHAFTPQAANQAESLKDRIKNGEDATLMILEDKAGAPFFQYWVKQAGHGMDPSVLSAGLRNVHAARLLQEAGLPDETVAKVLGDVSYQTNELGKRMMNGYLSAILVSMLLFFAIYFYSYGVSMSVASEKTSRVMELLVTSTKPSKIILGKSAGMGLLGLCQFTAVLVAAFVTYKLTFPKDFTLLGQQFDFSNFSAPVILMLLVYFILGYSLYAMMNAVAGATVSKAEDVNSAIMPISMVTMVAFYFGYATIMMPSGSIAVAASLIPFSSAFSMPSRLLMSDVPLWQILLSLGVTAATIVLMAWISIRLYAAAVLHYGKRLKLKELFHMSGSNKDAAL